ncbi:hypothetical protein [Nocardia sp. MW-W600-9]
MRRQGDHVLLEGEDARHTAEERAVGRDSLDGVVGHAERAAGQGGGEGVSVARRFVAESVVDTARAGGQGGQRLLSRRGRRRDRGGLDDDADRCDGERGGEDELAFCDAVCENEIRGATDGSGSSRSDCS